MIRFYSTIAFASLTLHVAVLSMLPAFASDTSCASSGADGCSCQAFACNVQNPSNTMCLQGDCANVGCYTEASHEGSFEIAEGSNATVCTSTGPLVGAGCSNGVSTYCKTIRTCVCDPFGHCNSSKTQSGFYIPCTPNP